MYNYPHYKDKDPQAIREFIEKNPFAFLIGCDAQNKPVATQVPLFLEEKNGKQLLIGHIAKNTDHYKALANNSNVLAVFSGHHAYVSATWYTNPHMASTWNYMSVHANGTIRFLDEQALAEVLRKTSLHFENNNPHSETIFDNLSDDYKQKYLSLIIAFEIEVLEMEHVFKLSQNRDATSYHNITEQLKQQGADAQAVAAEMEKRTQQLFGNDKKA